MISAVSLTPRMVYPAVRAKGTSLGGVRSLPGPCPYDHITSIATTYPVARYPMNMTSIATSVLHLSLCPAGSHAAHSLRRTSSTPCRPRGVSDNPLGPATQGREEPLLLSPLRRSTVRRKIVRLHLRKPLRHLATVSERARGRCQTFRMGERCLSDIDRQVCS